MKKLISGLVLICLLSGTLALSEAPENDGTSETVIPPQYSVYDYTEYLLDVARNELGEGEDARGNTKYGIWAGQPDAQWCAEFLCWCVNRVDELYGTQLLKNTYPLYSSTNVGRNWFIRNGRYIARKGNVPDWGTQWFNDTHRKIEKNEYIPQPGDWVFFSVYASGDTSHVALVEYTARDPEGCVWVHVIEGNNPDKVARNRYRIDDWSILGYGTVRDLAGITMRSGNEGIKVKRLQEGLVLLGYLGEQYITGKYAQLTTDAVKAYQHDHGIQETGIAGPETQTSLEKAIQDYYSDHPELWSVEE